MPFLGTTTLRDVIRDLKRREALPETGEGLWGTTAGRRGGARGAGKSGPDPAETMEAPAKDGQGASIFRPAGPTLDAAAWADPSRAPGRLSYVDAVLWVAARLADGLAHAHERGVVHRDLKPANILLTDDGQPMLLDFNLAADSTRRDRDAAGVGGTLPYMAPEHLEALAGGGSEIDGRSDVYCARRRPLRALTGRPPFETATSSTASEALRGDDRRAARAAAGAPGAQPRGLAGRRVARPALPGARPLPALPVGRAAPRGPGAAPVGPPLRHAPEPSPRERLRKWRRRNPRLASLTSLLVIGTALVAGLAAALAAREGRLASVEAARQYGRFKRQMGARKTG